MLDIKGAIAVITGGSGGIGIALAQKWLELGGKAVLADIDENALQTAKQQLGKDAETFFCDVTNEDDCAKLATFAIEKMGQINLIAPFAGIIRDAMLVSPDRDKVR